MSSQKFQSHSHCVGQKYYSRTKKNTVGDVTFNKKTGIEIKLFVAQCSTCSRKKFYDCGR